MIKEKINLGEILLAELNNLVINFPEEDYYSEQETKDSPEFPYFLKAMKEACRQTLELAIKNARIINDPNDYCENTDSEYPPNQVVSEKSILDTIKQIE